MDICTMKRAVVSIEPVQPPACLPENTRGTEIAGPRGFSRRDRKDARELALQRFRTSLKQADVHSS